MVHLVQEKSTPIFILLSLILIFLLINYDASVSIPYISIALLNLMIYFAYNRFKLSFDKNVNWLHATMLGVIVTAAFILVMNVLGKFLMPSSIITPFSVIEVMASQLPRPLLSQSLFFTWLSVGVIFPILETDFFFGRILDVLATRFKVALNYDFSNRKTWMLIFLVSSLFAIFHVTAKRGNLDIGLLFTFIFGIISCWMVLKYKRTAEAVMFHVIANTTYLVFANLAIIQAALH